MKLRPEQERVVERIAENIVLNDKVCACGMCDFGPCSAQQSGLLCQKGVTNWLTNRYLGR